MTIRSTEGVHSGPGGNHITMKDLAMIAVSWLIIGGAINTICQTIITTVEAVK